jgi:phosphoribosylglycinamide formyltransferase-1
MQNRAQIVVLISGRGSNLEALLKQQDYYQIIAVVSDKPDAFGLQLAKVASVSKTESFARENYESKAEQKKAIYSFIRNLKPDLICLAGFMQMIESSFVEEFYGRLINIHPSLLPALAGLETHRRAIEDGHSRHGCTAHYVDSGIDTGPIIAQASCDVLKGDTSEILSQRVLELEHKLYPWVLNAIAKKQIWLDLSEKSSKGKVRISSEALEEAQKMHFAI